MKRFTSTLGQFAAFAFAVIILGGCASNDGATSEVSGSAYYGVGFYDPWYHGGVYYPPDVIASPPVRPINPPHVENPIAKPPSGSVSRPLPSIPAAPRTTIRR